MNMKCFFLLKPEWYTTSWKLTTFEINDNFSQGNSTTFESVLEVMDDNQFKSISNGSINNHHFFHFPTRFSGFYVNFEINNMVIKHANVDN